jgi:secreted trypsin-like serine protease
MRLLLDGGFCQGRPASVRGIPILVLALAFAPIHRWSAAGTIREDRSDAVYQRMSTNPAFLPTGLIRAYQGSSFGIGSGTLIAPNWVLTAGHMAIVDGVANTAQEFVIGGQTYAVASDAVYVHSGWIASGYDLNAGYDLALFRLTTPVKGIKPASLNTDRNEVGQVIFTNGFGSTGTGLTGNTGAAGTRRAGQNVLDATAAQIVIPGRTEAIPVGSDRTLLYDFDSPRRDISTLGSAAPLNLEYSGAPGDSGGGAMIAAGRGYRIAGVVSGGYRPLGLRNGAYGTTAIYVRVSSHASWIRAVMQGGQPSLPQIIAQRAAAFQAANAAQATRARELAAKGWAETAFVGAAADELGGGALPAWRSVWPFFGAVSAGSGGAIDPFLDPAEAR